MKAGARSLTLLTALIAFGCSAGREADRSVPVAERATELPDLSAMAPPVAEQLRAQFDRLTKAKGDPATPREDLALAYGEMGKLLLAANAYLDAQPYFENARSLAPADARWTYYLAHTHRLEGQSTEAAALFDETVRARPDDVAALVWLGNTYLDQGNPAAAEPPFEKAVAMAPGVAAGHLGLGRVALERRQFAAAVHASGARPRARTERVRRPLPAGPGPSGAGQRSPRPRRTCDSGAATIWAAPDPLMQEVVDLLRSPVADESRGDKAIAAGDFRPPPSAYFRRGLELAPDSVSVRHKLATAQSLTGDVRGAAGRAAGSAAAARRTFPERTTAWACCCSATASWTRRSSGSRSRCGATPPISRPGCNWPTRSGGAAGSTRRSASTRTWWRGIPALARRGSARLCRWCVFKRFDEARGKLVDALRLFPNQPSLIAVLARVYADGAGRAGPGRRGRSRFAEQLVARGGTMDSAGNDGHGARRAGRLRGGRGMQREAIAAAREPASIKRPSGCATTWRLYERRQPCRIAWRDDPRWDG